MVIGEGCCSRATITAANAMKALSRKRSSGERRSVRRKIDPVQVRSYSRYLLCSNRNARGSGGTGTERRYFICVSARSMQATALFRRALS